jgi:short-subunit dehydrogenase
MGHGCVSALVACGCPLADAKAVLFVDHDKAEVGESHVFLDERGGADYNLNASVCNAGQGRFGALEEFSYARIRGLMDLNFTSHAFLVRAFLPLLKKAGRGDLVFIGSEAALQGTQKGSLYCASKFALRGFAQALRQECPRAGLRVSIVNPGMVRTPFFDELDFAPGPDPANFVLPEDVAQAVSMILAARPGTVFDEINLSPQKRVIEFGGKKQKGAPR